MIVANYPYYFAWKNTDISRIERTAMTEQIQHKPNDDHHNSKKKCTECRYVRWLFSRMAGCLFLLGYYPDNAQKCEDYEFWNIKDEI